MEQRFKNRPWPFVPECLSEIISEDILEIIQTGINLKHKIPLLIIEFRDGKPVEIEPIEPRIGFCEKFRAIKLRDGTSPADETCRICEYYAAETNIEMGTSIVIGYECHIGITKIITPILVAKRVVALFFAGQIVYEEEKDEIIERLTNWHNGVCSVRSEICKQKFENSGILERAKLVSRKEIDSLIRYIRKEMKVHTQEDFNKRVNLMQKYANVVSKLADTIHTDYKRVQEEGFFHKIASIFEKSEVTDIAELQKIVSKALDAICEFCGASSVILFANQESKETTLDIFETKGININNLRLNLQNIKGDLSKPVIIEEVGKWGFEGADKERIKKFILLPVIDNEYKISLALKHPSPDTIVAESHFFDNLSRLIEASMSNRREDIYLRKQHEELRKKGEELSKQYEELRERDKLLSEKYEELNEQDKKLGKEHEKLTMQHEKLKKDTADIAHRFKTELDPIRTKVGIWFSECRTRICSSTAKEHYDSISKDIVSLSEMVKKTLAPLKTETVVGIAKERISLASIVLDCIESFRPVAEKKGVRFEIDDSISQLPAAFIEKERFTLAIKNLLDNAIKYSFSNTRIKVDSWSDPGRVGIAFSNFGIGVFEDEKEQVFERSYRGRAAIEIKAGTGIGITEAREIIKEHGGNITLESYSGKRGADSDMGKGYVTKVMVTLPVEKNKEE